MISEDLYKQLLEAAALAPSADNMQPWRFQYEQNHILAFYERDRALPTDTLDMFGFISLGAAIQNIVVYAENIGLKATVTYLTSDMGDPFAKIHFEKDTISNDLAQYIPTRKTNRAPFEVERKIKDDTLAHLKNSISNFDISLQTTSNPEHFSVIANLDAHSSYIRLEYRPFHDELFEVLRFSDQENEKYRYGLTFESLEVPGFAISFAKFLKYYFFNDLVSKLGFGKLVAFNLSRKLKKTGCLCLFSCNSQRPEEYMEAGRALEQFWLTCTQMGISVQPYGVLPQYLTKLDVDPEFFTEKYRKKLASHKEKFRIIFPDNETPFPAILLRIGLTDQISKRSSIRLSTNNINAN